MTFSNHLKRLFRNKKVAVLGYGVEGRSTVEWLKKNEVDFFVCDQGAPEIESGIESYVGDDWSVAWKQADVFLRSPGIHPLKNGLEVFFHEKKILCQTDVLLGFVPERIVGITGTMGKGSTLALLCAVMDQAQKKYLMGGNFGIPAWDLMDGYSGEHLLLELSSFQLYGTNVSPSLGVILQTTCEHLDWHKDQEDYQWAKANLIRNQSKEQKVIFWGLSEGASKIANEGSGQKIDACAIQKNGVDFKGDCLLIDETRLEYSDCEINGLHQMENMAVAALVAKELGVNAPSIVNGLKSFKGLPLRTEVVGSKKGLTFINDSYATRPEATIGAVKSIDDDFVLILGGSEKGADFTELCKCLVSNKYLKKIQLIGKSSDSLRKCLLKANYKGKCTAFDSLENACADSVVEITRGFVVLSPACASFGMFKNYKHRGEVFNQWVRSYCEDL